MKTYVGIKEDAKPAVFESEKKPSKEAHPQYDVIFGPFKKREDAEKYVNAMGRGLHEARDSQQRLFFGESE
jgi:hypothetical protein